MRKLVSPVAVIALLLLVASTSSAQVRGRGRIQGQVTEKESGKPVAGAKVTVTIADHSTAPIIATTDNRGRWSALGLVNGQWNIDIEAPGFTTSRGSINVSELQMLPLIKTALAREVVEEAAPVAAAPSVPPDVVTAINEAQDLMKPQVGDVVTRTESTGATTSESVSHTVTAEDVKENHRRAATLIEEALPKLPTDTAELQRAHIQLQQLLSQAYYKVGDVKKAIARLEQVLAADPANHNLSMILVNMYLEDGRLPEGRALLEKLPADAVTDPTVYTNVGILFLNKGSAADALAYFTRAVDLAPQRHEAYYYRGLANVQLTQTAAAKADFQKVIELAPTSTEASDAKQLLAGL